LDDNAIALREQTRSVLAMLAPMTTLRVLSCQRCGLQMEIGLLIRGTATSDGSALQELHLAQNALSGTLPTTMFSESSIPLNQPYWPSTITLLDLSSNVGISGPLPPAGSGYADLSTIDLSNTSVSGPLPSSWSAFPSLQRLIATNTNLSCALTFDAAERVVSGLMGGVHGQAAARIRDSPISCAPSDCSVSE
jgi:hypothetical protein